MTSAALLERATETALTAGTVTTRPALRAVIYARVSSDPHNRGKSVADQIAECKRECAQRGWRLVEVFEDNDRSASRYATKERKDYARLVEFLRAGRADVLMTWESSRAQRDLEAYLRLREIAEGNGVQWCYKGRLYDLSRTDDRFTTGLDALLDERESGITRDRVLRGKKTSAAAGRPNGRMLYGYAREYDPRTGEFVKSVIREDQAAIVREAVRRLAAGEALGTLCREFNLRGLRTNTGGSWRKDNLRAMAINPGYIGKRVRHGVVIGDAEWPAIHQTPEERQAYYTCVRRLTDPARTTWRPGGLRHLSSGIPVCGVCGGKLYAAHWSKKKTGQSEGRIGYDCRGTDTYPGHCVAVTKDILDRHLSALAIERLSRPDAAELLADDDQQAEHIAALLAEAAEKRATLDETADKVAKGEMTVTMAARIEAQLLPEVEALERRAEEASTAPVLRGLIRSDAADIWPTLPLTQQREVIKALMDVTVLPRLTAKDPEFQVGMESRKELGRRLRAIRRAYGTRGMTHRRLSELTGWSVHKVSNAESARGRITADEVRLWCRLCTAESEADELAALVPADTVKRMRSGARIRITWKHDL
ncbi:recombinase family protein [Streptomyces noursei]|uniref:recombinase family protein n=1 Tax=Streptomyces noursei TaxID=1971 RepID=UPI001965DA92|nr:recombinase family protein [Streptomyces noursei]QRX90843.1 recombinase family protein [Streptomyces noursei]